MTFKCIKLNKPYLLKYTRGWDWGPKPFRFNNFWLQNKKFKGVVEEAWRNQIVSGWMSFVLKEKLKGLKSIIKVWNKEEDVWTWKMEESGVFTVKSTYLKLEKLVLLEEVWGEEEKEVFEEMWKSSAPSKMVAFVWKAIRNRVPTKDNLALRNVLSPETSTLCVLCTRQEESSRHLFLHCEVARLVWLGLMAWMGSAFLIPPNLFVHWYCWMGEVTNKKLVKGLGLIWHTTIWFLWKARNDKIFNNTTFEVDEIVEKIKVMSWRWLLTRTKTPVCLFYEWCWNPQFCLLR